MKAHDAFDPLWRDKHYFASRSGAYRWLAGKLEIQPHECHIGEFDMETCNKVVEVCNK